MDGMRFKLRQVTSFRTRIQFPGLRHQPACCTHVQSLLENQGGFHSVEVRPGTGSVVLVHPERVPDLNALIRQISGQAAALEKLKIQKAAAGGSGAFSLKTPDADKSCHVSGATLIVSGIHIGWLVIKRIFAPMPTAGTLLARLVSLPVALTLWLAMPIQRQAVENFKTTGRMDMSFISTGLLYLSLITGNILTALVVAWLYNLSGWMESRIRQHTRKMVSNMLTGRQVHAWKLVEGVEVRVGIEDLLPGDTIVLCQGSTVPVDGRVVKGTALVNEAVMTGESLPVVKDIDHTVLAGTLVEDGHVWVAVEKTGDQTRMASIIRLIESAQTDLGEMGRASLKISQYMVPVSLALAGVAFLMTGSLFLAIATIMVTCPCALRLSTSTAVSVAMGQAASKGILIKGGSHVETAGRVNMLVLDKTGTLTENTARVTRVVAVDRRYKDHTILKLAAAALATWNHPLSRAVAVKAHELDLDLPSCDTRKLVVGQGVEAKIRTGTGLRTLLAGSGKFMAERGVKLPESCAPGSGAHKARGRADAYPSDSVVYVAFDDHILGCIHATHVIRSDAGADTLDRLRRMGISHIILLTGDTREGTRDLIARLAFDEVHWGMSPEDKAEWIAGKKQENPLAVIAMAGDGINDTPAFSRSHLSFAVGEAGEDLTLECADVVLQHGGLGGVADTLDLGQHALSVIRKSYSLAIGLNSATLLLMLTGIISPFAGALIHNLITLTAVASAARPLKVRTR